MLFQYKLWLNVKVASKGSLIGQVDGLVCRSCAADVQRREILLYAVWGLFEHHFYDTAGRYKHLPT